MPLPMIIITGVGAVASGITILETARRARNKKRAKTAPHGPLTSVLDREKREREARALYKVLPATADDIAWMARFEAKLYGPDAVPYSLLADWYKANPQGFNVVARPDGTRVGHLDLLAVREQTMKLFIDGTISEREILGDWLYREDEKDRIRSLYVESLAIEPKYTDAGVLALLREFESLVARVTDPSQVEYIYGLAASQDGYGVMDHLDFEVISKKANRVDKHDLLRISYANLLSNLPKSRKTSARRAAGRKKPSTGSGATRRRKRRE